MSLVGEVTANEIQVDTLKTTKDTGGNYFVEILDENSILVNDFS